MQKAGKFGWRTLAETTLLACNKLYGTPLPPEVSQRDCPSWLVLYPKHGTEWSRLVNSFYWLDGIIPKLHRFWFVVFVQKESDLKHSHPLPRYARFLYTPFQLARHARKWIPRGIRSILGVPRQVRSGIGKPQPDNRA
jgi:hypothetical protein